MSYGSASFGTTPFGTAEVPSGGSGATASLSITAGADVFSGSASVPAACALAATLAGDAFSGSVSANPTIVTEPLKNNTGTVLASETGVTAHVYEVASGNKVVTLTGQATDVAGVMALSSALFSAATQYRVVVVLSGGAEGMAKYTTQ